MATVSVPTVIASPLKQPEWGRCVEAASGRYADAGCTERVGKGSVGTFEWLRGGSIVKRGITGVAAGAVLETVGGRTIGCGTSGDGSGESPEVEMPLGVTPLPPTASPETKFNQPKANGTLGFNNCVESTYGSCGTITTEPLKAELGYIAGAGSVDPSVGLDMKAANGKRFAEVSCPGAAQPIVVEGSVISHIEPVDEMTTNFTETYTASEGVQSPTNSRQVRRTCSQSR